MVSLNKAWELLDLIVKNILIHGLGQDDKKKIAQKLFISERTLYNHLANIYDKLGVSNAIEAYNKAMDLGYIDPVM